MKQNFTLNAVIDNRLWNKRTIRNDLLHKPSLTKKSHWPEKLHLKTTSKSEDGCKQVARFQEVKIREHQSGTAAFCNRFKLW